MLIRIIIGIFMTLALLGPIILFLVFQRRPLSAASFAYGESRRFIEDALTQQKVRAEQIKQLAEEVGLSYESRGDAQLIAGWSWSDVPVTDLEIGPMRIANVLRRNIGRAELYVFDIENSYQLVSDRGNSHFDFTMAAIRSLPFELPHIKISELLPSQSSWFLKTIAKTCRLLRNLFARRKYIGLSWAPRLAQKYSIVAADATQVQDLLTDDFQEFLANDATVSLEAKGDTLLVNRMEYWLVRRGERHKKLGFPGPSESFIYKLIPPEDILSFIEECENVYEFVAKRA